MKYPVGSKMKWDNADINDTYVIDSITKDGKYIVIVLDRNNIRYAEQKAVVTEKAIDSVFLKFCD